MRRRSGRLTHGCLMTDRLLDVHKAVADAEAQAGVGEAVKSGPSADTEHVDQAQQSPDVRSSPAPGWPRLLDIRQAAAYLNVSFWTLREFINEGSVPTVRLPRPRTPRMRKRKPVSDTVRRLLIDRADLDALVEHWKEAG